MLFDVLKSVYLDNKSDCSSVSGEQFALKSLELEGVPLQPSANNCIIIIGLGVLDFSDHFRRGMWGVSWLWLLFETFGC